MNSRLTQGLDFQAQALVLRSERQRLVASNIANADTPGYVARDFDFAQTLRQAQGIASSSQATAPMSPAMATGVTHEGHRPLAVASGFQPTLNYARAAQTNLDGNTVDMDRERATFADNAVKYEAALRFLNSGARTMLDAMKSHNQG
jgi:flagellar basal-body rod protein FlgB